MSVVCDHLLEAQPTPCLLVEHLQVDYCDGLTDGVVRCKYCRTLYYARAIAFWGGPTHGSRVYVIYRMPKSIQPECEALGAPASHRDVGCEASRQRILALARRRREPLRVICWDLHSGTLLASGSLPEGLALPGADAIARATIESDRPWFQHLGLVREDGR